MPNNPNPALFTSAAPVLAADDGPVPLAPDRVGDAMLLGVPLALAVLFPLQKIRLGLMPPSWIHFVRSATDCWTLMQ